MINNKALFNLSYLSCIDECTPESAIKNPKYLSVMYNSPSGYSSEDGSSIPLGTPCVVNKEVYFLACERPGSFSIPALIVFPGVIGPCRYPNYTISLYPDEIIAIGDSWMNTHKVIRTSSLIQLSYPDMMHAIKSRRSFTCIISTKYNKMRAIRELYTLTKMFRKAYAYSTMFHETELIENDEIILSFSFLNLLDCIPIFNTKKLDAIGILFRAFGRKTSKHLGYLNNIVESAFILTNYDENITVIDGAYIDEGYIEDAGMPFFKQITGFLQHKFPILYPNKNKGKYKPLGTCNLSSLTISKKAKVQFEPSPTYNESTGDDSGNSSQYYYTTSNTWSSTTSSTSTI
jgi:hypothetical protein